MRRSMLSMLVMAAVFPACVVDGDAGAAPALVLLYDTTNKVIFAADPAIKQPDNVCRTTVDSVAAMKADGATVDSSALPLLTKAGAAAAGESTTGIQPTPGATGSNAVNAGPSSTSTTGSTVSALGAGGASGTDDQALNQAGLTPADLPQQGADPLPPAVAGTAGTAPTAPAAGAEADAGNAGASGAGADQESALGSGASPASPVNGTVATDTPDAQIGFLQAEITRLTALVTEKTAQIGELQTKANAERADHPAHAIINSFKAKVERGEGLVLSGIIDVFDRIQATL